MKRISFLQRLRALIAGGRKPGTGEISGPESRYRRLFDGLPLGLYLTSPDGTIIDVNTAAVQLLGYPDREALMKANAFDIFADRGMRADQVKALEEEELIRGYEVQLRCYDGTLIWALDYARTVKDSLGRVKFYEGALEDITERKAAREQLKETNETLQALVGGSPLAIISHDLDGNVLSWNQAAESIFGWSQQEVAGKPLPIVPDHEWDDFVRMMRLVAQGETITASDLHRKRKDGSTVITSVSAAPLRNEDGSVAGVLGMFADLTKRREAEETQRRLAEILEGTPDLVGIASIDGHGIYLNPAGCRMLGVELEESTDPKLVWEYHPPEYAELIRNVALPSAISDGSWTGEVVFASADGREIPTSMVMIAHRTDDIADYISVIARDLTEQKWLEDRVRQAQTMDAIGRLAGGIAHDFNNLLTTIIGHSDLLLRFLADEQARDDVASIKEAGQRAATLTSQLLAFSRRQVLQLKPLDLNSVIGDIGSRLKEMVGSNIELATVLDGTIGRVKADSVQMEEVISALVENACEAMPDGGVLTLETADVELARDSAKHLGVAQPGRYAVLSVTDTGLGMDEETKARIFEPFFSTKKEVKGTGLGLPTVYGIIKQSGGEIWVSSEPASGTTVSIYLPVIVAERDAQTTGVPVIDGQLDYDRETILLVEDEPAVLNLAGRVLRAHGFSVIEAHDGVEALEAQRNYDGTIDLLITDVVMPRIGGPELATRMIGLRPELRVIYMSGYTDNKTVREMMADRSTFFLQKPFTPSALAAITKRVLENDVEDSKAG
jgi:PAS domain S-box-containing protein